MPLPAYMEVEGIPGGCQVSGREDTLEILQFDHKLHIPTDPKDGTVAGARVHGLFTVLKNYDKSSPELFKRLCNGTAIPKITLRWYTITPEGDETVYFTHTLENARVVKMRSWMPNILDAITERYKHMEEVMFQYEKITWKYEDGAIEFSDSWVEGR